MSFWTVHSIWYMVGFIFFPRLFMIYTGAIPPGSVGQVFGFLLVPRILLAAAATTAFWRSDPFMVGVLWVLGIVLDLAGSITKFSVQRKMFAQWRETALRGPAASRQWY